MSSVELTSDLSSVLPVSTMYLMHPRAMTCFPVAWRNSSDVPEVLLIDCRRMRYRQRQLCTGFVPQHKYVPLQTCRLQLSTLR